MSVIYLLGGNVHSDLAALRRRNTIFGPGWRLADAPFLSVQDFGSGGQGLHGFGAGGYAPGTYFYDCSNGQIRTGMVGFSYQLTDVRSDDGGFAVIPGVLHLCSFLLTLHRCNASVAIHMNV